MIKVDFWQGRYETENTPWDLGGPSPHFVALLNQKPDFLKPGKMAVFGSGRGHDAALFAQNSLDVTGFDYAPGAVEEARKLYGSLAIRFEQADLFDMSKADSPWAGQFDFLLEHTCFCAILPQDRAAYAQSARNILKPGGYLIGVFWEHQDEDGPPFSTTEADIRQIFGADFELCSISENTPASGRAGIERLAVLRRKMEV